MWAYQERWPPRHTTPCNKCAAGEEQPCKCPGSALSRPSPSQISGQFFSMLNTCVPRGPSLLIYCYRQEKRRKISAEPTCHVHPQPCWLSPFHPVLVPVTDTAQIHGAAASSYIRPVALWGRKKKTLLWGPQSKRGPCVRITSRCTEQRLSMEGRMRRPRGQW